MKIKCSVEIKSFLELYLLHRCTNTRGSFALSTVSLFLLEQPVERTFYPWNVYKLTWSILTDDREPNSDDTRNTILKCEPARALFVHNECESSRIVFLSGNSCVVSWRKSMLTQWHTKFFGILLRTDLKRGPKKFPWNFTIRNEIFSS